MWEGWCGYMDQYNSTETYLFVSWKQKVHILCCFQSQTEHWKLASLHRALKEKYLSSVCSPLMKRPFAFPLPYAMLLAFFQKHMHNAVYIFCSQHDTSKFLCLKREGSSSFAFLTCRWEGNYFWFRVVGTRLSSFPESHIIQTCSDLVQVLNNKSPPNWIYSSLFPILCQKLLLL